MLKSVLVNRCFGRSVTVFVRPSTDPNFFYENTRRFVHQLNMFQLSRSPPSTVKFPDASMIFVE